MSRRAMRLAYPESALQTGVEELLALDGWLFFHDRDARRNRAGLPDLVAVHPTRGRLLFAELKTERGRLRPDQAAWLDALELVQGPPEVYLWRTGDLDYTQDGEPLIARVLRGEGD